MPKICLVYHYLFELSTFNKYGNIVFYQSTNGIGYDLGFCAFFLETTWEDKSTNGWSEQHSAQCHNYFGGTTKG